MATMRRVLSGDAVGVPLLAVDISFCKELTRALSSVTDLTLIRKAQINNIRFVMFIKIAENWTSDDVKFNP